MKCLGTKSVSPREGIVSFLWMMGTWCRGQSSCQIPPVRQKTGVPGIGKLHIQAHGLRWDDVDRGDGLSQVPRLLSDSGKNLRIT